MIIESTILLFEKVINKTLRPQAFSSYFRNYFKAILCRKFTVYTDFSVRLDGFRAFREIRVRQKAFSRIHV